LRSIANAEEAEVEQEEEEEEVANTKPSASITSQYILILLPFKVSSVII
jgi:hypothetical protein